MNSDKLKADANKVFDAAHSRWSARLLLFFIFFPGVLIWPWWGRVVGTLTIEVAAGLVAIVQLVFVTVVADKLTWLIADAARDRFIRRETTRRQHEQTPKK